MLVKLSAVALVFVVYGLQYDTSEGAENGDMEWMITRKTKDKMENRVRWGLKNGVWKQWIHCKWSVYSISEMRFYTAGINFKSYRICQRIVTTSNIRSFLLLLWTAQIIQGLLLLLSVQMFSHVLVDGISDFERSCLTSADKFSCYLWDDWFQGQ